MLRRFTGGNAREQGGPQPGLVPFFGERPLQAGGLCFDHIFVDGALTDVGAPGDLPLSELCSKCSRRISLILRMDFLFLGNLDSALLGRSMVALVCPAPYRSCH